MAEKQILIICGEASGDLHAGTLAKEIKRLNPHIKISAVGGPHLLSAGAEIFYDIKNLSVIGLFDVLNKLPLFFELKRRVKEEIEKRKPAAVIFVDFSGFNLRLAKELNNTVPAIYYISPQLWASRPGRVEMIKKYIRAMIVFFKFEQEFYLRHGLKVECVGHPLLDIVKPTQKKSEFLRQYNLRDDLTTIALLPGSRNSEVSHILPVMLESAVLVRKRIRDIQVLIAKSTQVDEGLYERIIDGLTMEIRVVEGKTYDCVSAADFCLVASGTATLETAILQKPFAVIYKMDILNYLLYRPMVKIPNIGMVNIVAGKRIVPEFIQFKAYPRAIAETTISLLENPAARERMKRDLLAVRMALGDQGAAARAAKIVTTFLR